MMACSRSGLEHQDETVTHDIALLEPWEGEVTFLKDKTNRIVDWHTKINNTNQMKINQTAVRRIRAINSNNSFAGNTRTNPDLHFNSSYSNTRANAHRPLPRSHLPLPASTSSSLPSTSSSWKSLRANRFISSPLKIVRPFPRNEGIEPPGCRHRIVKGTEHNVMTCHIQSIPDEVLLYILALLFQRELKATRCVSHKYVPQCRIPPLSGGIFHQIIICSGGIFHQILTTLPGGIELPRTRPS